MNDLGYTKNLFILAFDHQSSFERAGFEHISDIKNIIYEAFKKSLDVVQNSAILVDEKYADSILKDAKESGYTVALKIEKSGQKDFIFEYGDDFSTHIEKYNPDFAKVVIKVSEGVSDLTKNNLKKLSDYCHSRGTKFLLELISDGNLDLILKTIEGLQNRNIEPDVWKIEGMENDLDYTSIVNEVKRNGRENVSIVILGRGEGKEVVEKWIKIGSKISGVIGFAIGRTIFWEPLVEFNSGRINREQAIEEISRNYIHFYNLFKNQ